MIGSDFVRRVAGCGIEVCKSGNVAYAKEAEPKVDLVTPE
jgi:hypothetical protein